MSAALLVGCGHADVSTLSAEGPVDEPSEAAPAPDAVGRAAIDHVAVTFEGRSVSVAVPAGFVLSYEAAGPPDFHVSRGGEVRQEPVTSRSYLFAPSDVGPDAPDVSVTLFVGPVFDAENLRAHASARADRKATAADHAADGVVPAVQEDAAATAVAGVPGEELRTDESTIVQWQLSADIGVSYSGRGIDDRLLGSLAAETKVVG